MHPCLLVVDDTFVLRVWDESLASICWWYRLDTLLSCGAIDSGLIQSLSVFGVLLLHSSGTYTIANAVCKST